MPDDESNASAPSFASSQGRQRCHRSQSAIRADLSLILDELLSCEVSLASTVTSLRVVFRLGHGLSARWNGSLLFLDCRRPSGGGFAFFRPQGPFVSRLQFS